MNIVPVQLDLTAQAWDAPAILLYAARKFSAGAWGWHRGGDKWDDGCNCALTAITQAAREVGRIDLAYDAVMLLTTHLGEPIGPWNDSKTRMLSDVIDAYRCAAGAPVAVAAQ